MTTVERLVVPLGGAAAGLVAEIHGRSFPTAWTADEIRGLAAMPGAFVLLAHRDETPVGVALARCAADEAEIVTIGVVPEARRAGAGRALLRAVIETAAGAGAGSLFIEVADDNAAALSLYTGEGFVEVGRRRAYYGDGGADALVMRRPLGAPDEDAVDA